jgi:hypothetical protein
VVAAEPDVLVNKTRKMLNGVQEGLNLQLNSWSPGLSVCVAFELAIYSNRRGSAISFTALDTVAPSLGGGGERRRRPSEPPFASPPVATRNGLARPRPEARPRRAKTPPEKSCRGAIKTGQCAIKTGLLSPLCLSLGGRERHKGERGIGRLRTPRTWSIAPA